MLCVVTLTATQRTASVSATRVFSRNAALKVIIATTTRAIPILLIADLRAMECRSPAAPLTVCDLGIEGVDGLGAVEADVVLGSAEADRGCAGFLGGMVGCRSFSR